MRRIILATAVTAGLVVIAPAPAQAVVEVDGYVWASLAGTANYIADTGYEYNSAGGVIEITRQAAGRYHVRFAGMGSPGGVAHVRAYGSTNKGICTVVNWSSAADLNLYVRCFDTAGALADSRFVASFTNRSAPAGTHFAYFWANQLNPALPYEPMSAYAYDSTGEATQIEKLSVGRYIVYIGALSDLYPSDHNDGHLQVTAYNSSAVHCGMRVAGDEDPTPLDVRCYDAAGNLTDSRFVVSYSHEISHLGAQHARGNAFVRSYLGEPYFSGYWNEGGEPTVNHPAVGQYEVRFPGLGESHGHAIVTSQEMVYDRYCNVGSWFRDAMTDEQVVNVRCYDASTNLAVDYDFGVSFTT